MTNSKRRFAIRAGAFLAVTLIAVAPLLASAADAALVAPKLNISIPGLDLAGEMKKTGGDAISTYVAGVYRFLIGIIGLVAGVMIMVGGFTYLTAGGDKSKIDEAKKRITNAIAGIVLAFTSYLMLYALNPDLVNFKALKIIAVTPQQFVSTENTSQDITAEDLAAPNVTPGKIPLFKQFDKRWASTSYGGCGTIQSSGCGPTSAAMVLSSYGVSAYPPDVAKAFADNGFRGCSAPDCNCKGTLYGAFTSDAVLSQWNFHGQAVIPRDQDTISKLLNQGTPVIVSVGPSIFTKNGHFIVLAGLDSSGKVIINDPNKRVYDLPDGTKITDGHVPPELVFPNIKSAFVLTPNSQ
jgi:hypothetical protein